jgi:hypothetical protein
MRGDQQLETIENGTDQICSNISVGNAAYYPAQSELSSGPSVKLICGGALRRGNGAFLAFPRASKQRRDSHDVTK